MNTFRLFIAIKIPEHIISKIEQLGKNIKNTYSPNIRWTPPENMHITLAFLGTRTKVDIDALVSSMPLLSTFILNCKPLSECFISFFGSPSHPRILYCSYKSVDKRLHELAKTVRINSLSKPENKWIPHITLGRYRDSASCKDTAFISSLKIPELSFTPEKVILYSSILQNSGPVYTPLFELK